jgi:hypothetical protein
VILKKARALIPLPFVFTVAFKKADGEIYGTIGIDIAGKLRINSTTDECIGIDARVPVQSEIDAAVGTPQVIFGSNGSPRGRIHLDGATSQMWLTAESFVDSNGATLPCASAGRVPTAGLTLPSVTRLFVVTMPHAPNSPSTRTRAFAIPDSRALP